MIIKVFDVGEAVKTNSTDDTQKKNILKIFDELSKESHLITNCFLDLQADTHTQSPIYKFHVAEDKNNFDYKEIAEDLLNAESKADKTRNSTIREGLLFIKAEHHSLTLMKLEKLTVIDKETYAFKSELGKEKDYFKVATFNGSFTDIQIIDKNKTAAKYWYEKFLMLTRKRTNEDNTKDVINLLLNKELFQEEIVHKEDYKEIKRFTEYYLFDNKRFDKSTLFNQLNSHGLIELNKEIELYSDKASHIDSDFDIAENILNAEYKRKIQVSSNITITTQNYLSAIRDNLIEFDEQNKKIVLYVEDEFLARVKEELDDTE